MIRSAHPAPAAVVTAVAVVATAVVVTVAALLPRALSSDVPPGGALSDRDRAYLAAAPVARGADAPPADPTVDRTDPDAVARAYLAAAYSVGPGDAGATQRRAAAYAAPESVPVVVGALVLDPPRPGSLRTATVTGLQLDAASADGARRGYRAELGMATAPPGAPAAVTLTHVRVALARAPDGRWLVTSDTADLPTGED